MDELIIISGVVCTVGGFIFAYLAFKKTQEKDNKEDGGKTAQITSDMGYVKKGIEGINIKLEKQDERHIQIIERICNVETSAKSAHNRIDSIEKKGE